MAHIRKNTNVSALPKNQSTAVGSCVLMHMHTVPLMKVQSRKACSESLVLALVDSWLG